jgi:hypothetical protein
MVEVERIIVKREDVEEKEEEYYPPPPVSAPSHPTTKDPRRKLSFV